jgi:hypothetical protein
VTVRRTFHEFWLAPSCLWKNDFLKLKKLFDAEKRTELFGIFRFKKSPIYTLQSAKIDFSKKIYAN